MNHSNFNNWQELLENLNTEKNEQNDKRVFYNTDVNTSNTDEKIIDEKADFANHFFEELYEDLSNALSDQDKVEIDVVKNPNQVKQYWSSLFWNESISSLLSQYWFYFDQNDNKTYEDNKEKLDKVHTKGDIPVKGGMIMQSSGVKNGDAGYNFNKESEMYENWDETKTYREVKRPWVNPWYNIDGDTYKNVRGSDKHLSVLDNDDHLQKTRTQKDTEVDAVTHYKWPRLLMPENKRKVEVEDLDRNFWVIGQVIASMSAYLFDEDSPINALLGGIINEILQLWENVMFLWADFATINKRKYDKTHCEVIYLTSNTQTPYVKYDDFYQNINSQNLTTEIRDKLDFLQYEYKDFNLAILPCIRVNNHEKNYYGDAYYPFLLVLNRTISPTEWQLIEIKEGDNFLNTKISNYYDNLYAFKEYEDTYNYFFPVEDYSDYDVDSDTRFYISARGIETISMNIDEEGISDFSLQIEYEDAFRKLIKTGDNSIFTIECSLSNNAITATRTDTAARQEKTNDIESVNISKGIYLGELVSRYQTMIAPTWEIEVISLTLEPYFYKNTIESNNADRLVNTNNEALYDAPTSYNIYKTSIVPPSDTDAGSTAGEIWQNSWFGIHSIASAIVNEDLDIFTQYLNNLQKNPHKIYFINGDHMYGTDYQKEDGKAKIRTGDSFTYYKVSYPNAGYVNPELKTDRSFELDGRSHYYVATQGYAKGCVLYMPKFGGSLRIPDYLYRTDYWRINSWVGSGYGLSNYGYEIYYKGNKLSSDNWVIRWTNVAALAVPDTSMPNNPSFDYANSTLIPLDPPYMPSSSEQYHGAIVTGVATTYIHPDRSVNERFMLRKIPTSAEPQTADFQTLSQIEKFDSQRDTVYEVNWNYRPDLNDGWKLWGRGTFTGYAIRNNALRDLSALPDFEHYPENGYAGTRMN